MNKKYSLNHEFAAEHIKIIYRSLIPSQIGMFLASIVLVVLLNDITSIQSIVTWLSLIIVTIIYRVVVLRLFYKTIDTDFNVQYWEKLFLFGVFLSAISWGLAGILLFPKDSITHQAFIIIALTGIIAASIGTLASNLKALYMFIPIVVLPILINILISNNEYSISLAVMIALFILISLITGIQFNKRIRENLLLKINSIKREQDLNDSEKKYRLLYEKSEDPMFLFKGTKFSMVNDAAVKLFGYKSIPHLIKTPPFDLSPIFQPNNVKSILKAEHIFRIIKSKGHYNTEWTCKHYDGHYFPIEVTLTLIPSKSDIQVFCIFRDITKKKKIENELRLAHIKSEDAKKKSEEASDAKSDFLANMSHEIRTPMNGVIGTTEILLKTDLSQQQKNFAQTIKNSAHNMLTIINDILDYSKIEAGMFDIDKHPFNMKDLIKQFTSSIINKFDEKGIKFIVKTDAKINQWYLGDSGRIRQILTNLVGNALKFTDSGNITLIAKTIKKQKNISHIKFQIIDTGIGISKEKQKKIFNRFTQADGSTTRKYGGTGLGLSICKQLTDLMHGDIGFISKIGHGTNFWFSLQLQSSEQPENILRDYNQEELKQFNSRVLIVEDNKTNQLVAEGMLKLFGLRIDIVENGKESLLKLEKFQYDLVFMDCHMPVLDGYKATQEIRHQNSNVLNPQIPIIAMTASAMQGDREKCIAYGMDDYITKPVDLKELEDILNKWLSKSEYTVKKPSNNKLKNVSSTLSINKNNIIPIKKTPEVKPKVIKNKVIRTPIPARKKEVYHQISNVTPQSQIVDDIENFELIFDFEALKNRLSGNLKLIKEIVGKFIPSMLDQIQDLYLEIDDKNIAQIITCAHKLKGSSATIGCMQLSHYAYKIEMAGRENNYNKAKKSSKMLKESYLSAKRAIEKKLLNE